MIGLSGHRTTAGPTMADVAAEAHVSVKTVSRVVNHEPGVRPETQARVKAVIDRIGFARRGDARVLMARTQTIGLVIEDLANPFYSLLSAAVEREARIHRHQLITASAEGSPIRQREVLDGLVARRVDGIVLVPADEDASTGPALRRAGIPVVYVDRPVRDADADIVVSDNAGGIRSAVEHLVARGHRNIGFLGDVPEFWTARRRRDAFAEVHGGLDLPGTPRVVMGPHSVQSLSRVLAAWCGTREPVTAVVTGNNRVTVTVLHALQHSELSLALVGYDDFELADLVVPSVTVIHQDPAALGQKAAQQLFARLLGDESPPETVVMPTRLIVRSSSAVPGRTATGVLRH
ncbi:LacI family DNA-binding transcriptional regulator [Phycicoccus sp. M110.8]|uniref:LacI family DNA-binding transcriptional regulator n=1 Tax=Phycicoccus sp. M110.8 TaxID=3075433 RepID=UPI0028FD17D1|nr:LacI family DNA-binding transcriptional regulator [Phycicoccus sp. M110.8]MDU0315041.1 LacI family DNA-binding transcriptional regulator [Phycicoccus sp. M110.8]